MFTGRLGDIQTLYFVNYRLKTRNKQTKRTTNHFYETINYKEHRQVCTR